jgi:HAD superfamily hydrolase (TIGR01490 family)
METIFSDGSNTRKKYIAFFDLDRTIISSNSGKILFQYSFKQGFMTGFDLIRAFYLSFLYRFKIKDPVNIIGSMVRWMKGLTEDNVNELSSGIFDYRLLGSIRQEVKSEISFHKSRGAGVVILSSAILPICRKVAGYLEMDDVVCSNLEVVDGVYTGRPDGPYCFGLEKVTRLIDFCEKNGIHPSDSWYYGDSISDFDVLRSVGNPVCINPDRKLKKAAKSKGWKILIWH